MRRFACLCLLTGCFSEGPGGGAGDDDASETTGGSVDDTSGATDPSSTTAGSASASASSSNPTTSSADDTTGTDDTGTDDTTTDDPTTATTATTADEESSSTGEPDVPTWCDEQPPEVVLCADFDGEIPFLGLVPYEMNGTVDVSDAQAVSGSQSMRVEVMPSATESSNASVGRNVIAAPLPFTGELRTRVWIDDGCTTGASTGVERLLLALQFFDPGVGAGEFELNLTIWMTGNYVKLYESAEPLGYPSTPHQIDVSLATNEWTEIALRYDGASTVTVTIDADEYPTPLDEATDDVISAIADIVPAIAVGTTMAQGQPGCTMYFDDVTVAAE